MSLASLSRLWLVTGKQLTLFSFRSNISCQQTIVFTRRHDVILTNYWHLLDTKLHSYPPSCPPHPTRLNRHPDSSTQFLLSNFLEFPIPSLLSISKLTYPPPVSWYHPQLVPVWPNWLSFLELYTSLNKLQNALGAHLQGGLVSTLARFSPDWSFVQCTTLSVLPLRPGSLQPRPVSSDRRSFHFLVYHVSAYWTQIQ